MWKGESKGTPAVCLDLTNPDIVDIKPANMEDLTEVITASEFHPHHCNLFVYSSSKGSLRLCDMRAAALCDKHSKLFEEPEDPSNRSFFSEIISSVSDVKFSHSGRYMLTRDYLTVKVWDLNMEARPIETYQVCIEVWRPPVCLSVWCEIAQEPPFPCTDNPQGCPATGSFFPWCSVDETVESLWGGRGDLRMGLSPASRTPTSGEGEEEGTKVCSQA